MAIYEKKWWKELFAKPTKKKKVDVVKDIEAITESLQDLPNDQQFLIEHLNKLIDLEREYHVAKSGIIQVNLETQATLLDKIIERYEFLQNDIAINGIRIQEMANEFLQRADKAGMKDLVKEKKQDQKWIS